MTSTQTPCGIPTIGNTENEGIDPPHPAGNFKFTGPTMEGSLAWKTKPNRTPSKDHNARDKQPRIVLNEKIKRLKPTFYR